jgi:hypothetical protein
MDGSIGLSEPQDETTMPSRIVWIVLQKLTRQHALLNLVDKYVFILALILCVERELIVVHSYLLPEVL